MSIVERFSFSLRVTIVTAVLTLHTLLQLLCGGEEHRALSLLPTTGNTPCKEWSTNRSRGQNGGPVYSEHSIHILPLLTHFWRQEFSDKFADRHQILKFSSKRVTKRYAFELPDVPSECEYLEVKYSADYPAPSMDDKGRSYSRVFGTNTSW